MLCHDDITKLARNNHGSKSGLPTNYWNFCSESKHNTLSDQSFWGLCGSLRFHISQISEGQGNWMAARKIQQWKFLSFRKQVCQKTNAFSTPSICAGHKHNRLWSPNQQMSPKTRAYDNESRLTSSNLDVHRYLPVSKSVKQILVHSNRCR